MTRCAPLLLIVFAALAALSAPISPAAMAGGVARFAVTGEVINPQVGPFTASIAAFGAGSKLVVDGGGFEPLVIRTKLMAIADAPDRIIAKPHEITRYRVLREGALDGARVDIYRIENGEFRRVRRDRIAKGGYRASGWTTALGRNRYVPRAADGFVIGRARHNKPGAVAWYAVRAVDEEGRLSPLSAPVRVVMPEKVRPKAEAPDLGRMKKMRTVDGGPGRPTGLRASAAGKGAIALRWDQPPDQSIAGYVVYASETPPGSHRGYEAALEGEGAPIRAGDMAILSLKLYEPRRDRLLTDRVWGVARTWRAFKPRMIGFWPGEDPNRTWRLEPHTKGSPVEDPGETFLRLSLAARSKETLKLFNHSGARQNFYPVLELRPYRVSFWARSERPGRIGFRLSGELGKGRKTMVFQTGPKWRRFEGEFTPRKPPETGKPNAMLFDFAGPNEFSIDNIRIHRADAGYLSFTSEDAARLRKSGMSALRTHEFGKVGLRSFDLGAFTNPGGATSFKGGNTLPQTLEALDSVGMSPWLQVPMHFSPEEWLGLVEYLAAPFDPSVHSARDRPWAAKRHAQGRAAPWVDAFDRIIFEVSNETWNRLFDPWTFPAMTDAATGVHYKGGQVYGAYHDFVVATMRSSPFWRGSGLDEKFETVIGGWRARPYGAMAARVADSADHLTVAAYNGGWDEGEGPPTRSAASYFNVLNQVSQSIAPSAARHAREVAKIGRGRDKPLHFGSYEAGPGYALNGLNGARVTAKQSAVQEEVMKSQAAGVATLDSFLAQAAAGARLQNFFLFKEGPYWSSHARWTEGGHAHPGWDVLRLFNQVGAGEMLAVDTLAAPRADLAAARKRVAIEGAPLVAAYATRRDGELIVIVVSRRVPDYPVSGDDGFTEIRLDLPIGDAKSARLHRMAGAYDANTVGGDSVAIEVVELGPFSLSGEVKLDERFGVGPRGLPPGSMLVYVFGTE